MDQPSRFGKYALLDRISMGGMAEVFRARGADGKLYAIKRILPSLAEDESFIKMFVQEARIAGQLVHPNICRIYELGRFEGTHFIVMEYVWGRDLTQVRSRLGKLKRQMPLEMTCAIMTMALEGLDYAHKKRDGFSRPLDLVHRDCSPHNMLISYDGEVKLIDFGIAKARSSIVKTVGVLKGKFAYMSPEQTMGKPIDHRSDIFSMGIVLYEMVTGERLFSGDSDFAVLERVRTVDIRPARDIVPTLPEAIEQVIARALTADREARYQWCDEMRGALAGIGAASRVELATWLRELFANEIAKEREDLGLSTRAVRRSEPMAAVAEPTPAPAPMPAPAPRPRRSEAMAAVAEPAAPPPPARPTPRPAKPRSNTELEPEIERIDMLDLEDEQTSIRAFPTANDVAAGDDEPLELLELPPQQAELPPWLRKR